MLICTSVFLNDMLQRIDTSPFALCPFLLVALFLTKFVLLSPLLRILSTNIFVPLITLLVLSKSIIHEMIPLAWQRQSQGQHPYLSIFQLAHNLDICCFVYHRWTPWSRANAEAVYASMSLVSVDSGYYQQKIAFGTCHFVWS